MSDLRTWRGGRQAALLGSTALIAAAMATGAVGQELPGEGSTLSEIIVTAQKREQSLQEVPIAVTALSQEALQTNRVVNVFDLNAIVPNVTMLTTAGGAGIPTWGVRGVVSAGSVPGQDKAVAMYLDGVSIGSAYGQAFDLPDLERIEVLRGPQGTLFGRNATGGAVSIITRDPAGEFHLRQSFTYGNYDQFRSSTRVDLPAWGALSASISYTHDERKGDIKNLGAGQAWDRTGPGSGKGYSVSPKRLGNKDANSIFAQVKFEPNDNFKTVWKFDWMENNFTPEGTAIVAFTPEAVLPPTFAPLVRAIFNANPPPMGDSHRPKYVNNSWVAPGFSKVYGHNVTSTLRINDQLSVKNIFGYRMAYNFAPSEISGAGGLKNIFSFLGPVGSPFVLYSSQSEGKANQWSEELQVNYDSKFLTLTAGGLYFDLHTRTGAPGDLLALPQFTVIPAGRIPSNVGVVKNLNDARSWAAYVQAEAHITPQLDVVAGYRTTTDKKSGTSFVGTTTNKFDFTYKKTRPTYLIGVNYKATDDILAYAKYSTGFVAGGSVSTIDFEPETVEAWEGGIKSDLFGRRLRLNVAVFDAEYHHLQAVGFGQGIGRPELGTIVIDNGNLKTKGFEVETTAIPMRGLTLNGTLGYTDFEQSNVSPLIGTDDTIRPTYRAHWTGTLSAQYESEPVFGEARVLARIDGNWRSKMPLISQIPILPAYREIADAPAGWVVNGRIALRNIELAGGDLEVALWGRNLTDYDRPMFPINFFFAGSTSYFPARTFGVDVTYNY